MPYWRRLLQADIFPQKLSRRNAIVIFFGSSGVAWMSTGTRRSARRKVSAMARSSPKFGSVTTMPSIRSRFFLKSSAQWRDSSRVSTAPYLLCSGIGGHYIHTRAVERTNHFLAAALCQMIGKKSAVPHDESHCHFSCCHKTSKSEVLTRCSLRRKL